MGFARGLHWKQFRASFPGNMHFYHIDEFETLFGKSPQGQAQVKGNTYPVVYSREGKGKLSTVLSTDRLNEIRDLEELIQFFKDWVRFI